MEFHYLNRILVRLPKFSNFD